MDSEQFSIIEEVNPREIWRYEDTGFTKWLAKSENLKALNDELGIMIEPEGTEIRSGRYYADIVGKTEDGDTVIIENQLECTDHGHLGKIVVYAAENDAKFQIWVVTSATEEHKKAVDWLNEHSDESINIFLVELHILTIDGSRPALQFDIVCKPDDWSDKTKNTKDTPNRRFWEGFRNYCQNSEANNLVSQNAPDRNSYNCHIGDRRYFLRVSFNSIQGSVAVKFMMRAPYQEMLYSQLEQHKEEIQQYVTVGHKWDWNKSRIQLISDLQFDIESVDKEEVYGWMLKALRQFKEVMPKFLAQQLEG